MSPDSIGESGRLSQFSLRRIMLMADVVIDLLKAQFRQLRLPTMGREFERLARDAAATNQNFFQFLLCLTETELATRSANAVVTRIRNAAFPVLKDFDTYDFTVLPQLSKPKILELARCEWVEQKYNCCLVGSHGTGKTHIAVSLGQAACRAGLRVRFFTAADLVTQLEKAQKQYTLDRFLGQLERAHLLIC
jgi:DNA replication protein DnaC